jgi:hypothetical protein
MREVLEWFPRAITHEGFLARWNKTGAAVITTEQL